MTKRECAIVMAYTGKTMLAGDNLGVFYDYLKEILGKTLWTHELADEKIWKEIEEKSKPDFIELCRTATD